MGGVRPFGRRALLQGAALLGAAAVGACARDTAGPPDGEIDLLVVGAGIAGLSAARYATAQGLRVVVLEARERVGGRIWTSDDWPDVPVDLGASWIHGTDGNPVYDEITRLGIETAVFDVGSLDGSGSLILYSGNGTRLDADGVDAKVADALNRLERGARGGSAMSMQAGIDALPRTARTGGARRPHRYRGRLRRHPATVGSHRP